MEKTNTDGPARESGSAHDAEVSATRELVAEAQRFQSDPDRFIALHTADASIVNFGGRRVIGGDAIYAAMKGALETPLAQVTTTVEIEDVRFVRPDVAIVAGVKHVSDGRATSLKEDPGTALSSTSGWLTYVMVKDQGAWRIVSAQTTPIRT
jgi:uncharacterized protein (TIGR02246 family)